MPFIDVPPVKLSSAVQKIPIILAVMVITISSKGVMLVLLKEVLLRNLFVVT